MQAQMFGDIDSKLIWKNCIQQIAKPDLLEGVVVKPVLQMKAVMENSYFFGQLYYNLSHAHFPWYALMFMGILTHAHTTQHVYSCTYSCESVDILNLTPLRDQAGSPVAGLWQYAQHVSVA